MADMTIDECRRLFSYEPIAGVLIWKARPVGEFTTVRAWKIWNARFASKVAGTLRVTKRDRYFYIHFGGRLFAAHRLIWAFVKGEVPPDLVDHINGDTEDNRIENLRCVTNAENLHNQKIRVTNKTGVTGVRWVKRYNKCWRAEIVVFGKRHSLGYFHDKESAIVARKAAEVKFGFHPNHGRAAA